MKKWFRRWWVLPALAGTVAVVAYVLQVLLNKNLSALAYWSLLGAGGACAGLALILPIQYAREQESKRLTAEQVAQEAISRHELQVANIYILVAEHVSGIASSPVDEVRERKAKLQQAVVHAAADYFSTKSARACYYEFDRTADPREFVCDGAWSGRNKKPGRRYDINTDRGKWMFELLASGEARHVPDPATEGSGYRPLNSEYSSFLAVTVAAGSQNPSESAHGILTLDAPAEGNLEKNDLLPVRLLAQLLAAGLSVGSRNPPSPGQAN